MTPFTITPKAKCIDYEGTELQVGDRVELTQNAISPEWIAGVQGIVKDVTRRPPDPGIQFDVPCACGNDLHGQCPDKFGYFMPRAYVRLIGRGANLLSEDADEETAIKTLIQEVTKTNVALIDRRFYTLAVAEKPEADQLLKPILEGFANKLKVLRASSQQALARERAKIALIQPMPEVSWGMATIQGMRVYKEDSLTCYIMPFRYAPKFLCADGSIPTAEISAKHQSELARDTFFCLQVSPDFSISSGGLYNPDWTYFCHYHGDGEDCLGREGKFDKIHNPAEAFLYRNKYQKTLELLNSEHRLDDTPPGLPSIQAVKEDAEEIEPEQLNPKKLWLANLDNFPVGCLVEVIKTIDAFPSEGIGAIGKVTGRHKIGGYIGVEFLFTLPIFHSCDKQGRDLCCYWFEPTCLKPAPEGKERTEKTPPFDLGTGLDRPFKVGDRVRAKLGQTTCKFGGYYKEKWRQNGGRVTAVIGPGELRLTWIGTGDPWDADSSELEFFPEPGEAPTVAEQGTKVDRTTLAKFGQNGPAGFDQRCLVCGERYGEHCGGGLEVICPRDYEAWKAEDAERRA